MATLPVGSHSLASSTVTVTREDLHLGPCVPVTIESETEEDLLRSTSLRRTAIPRLNPPAFLPIGIQGEIERALYLEGSFAEANAFSEVIIPKGLCLRRAAVVRSALFWPVSRFLVRWEKGRPTSTGLPMQAQIAIHASRLRRSRMSLASDGSWLVLHLDIPAWGRKTDRELTKRQLETLALLADIAFLREQQAV